MQTLTNRRAARIGDAVTITLTDGRRVQGHVIANGVSAIRVLDLHRAYRVVPAAQIQQIVRH